MECIGKDILSGSGVEVTFGETIESVIPAASSSDIYLAPGWIDIQVNGFGGVDYNNPSTTHDEIARSLQLQFACGVTRLYPTVITGSPDDMYQALRNVSRAKDSLPEGAAMDGFHVEGPH